MTPPKLASAEGHVRFVCPGCSGQGTREGRSCDMCHGRGDVRPDVYHDEDFEADSHAGGEDDWA